MTKPQDEHMNTGIKKRRVRSPNYPSSGLNKALERVKELYDEYGLAGIPITVAMPKWGYRPKSAGGMQLVATLKSFGLIGVEGSKEKRVITLTDRCHKILEGHKDSIRLIQKAALEPQIYEEIWSHFDNKIPSDDLLAHYLQWDRKFNPTTIPSIIDDYKDTISFAKLNSGDIVNIDGIPASGSKSPETTGLDEETGSTTAAQTKKTLLPQGGPNMETDTFNLDEGTVALQYPKTLSQDSYDDFKDWVDLQLRKIGRRINKEPSPDPEEKNK